MAGHLNSLFLLLAFFLLFTIISAEDIKESAMHTEHGTSASCSTENSGSAMGSTWGFHWRIRYKGWDSQQDRTKKKLSVDKGSPCGQGLHDNLNYRCTAVPIQGFKCVIDKKTGDNVADFWTTKIVKEHCMEDAIWYSSDNRMGGVNCQGVNYKLAPIESAVDAVSTAASFATGAGGAVVGAAKVGAQVALKTAVKEGVKAGAKEGLRTAKDHVIEKGKEKVDQRREQRLQRKIGQQKGPR